MGFLETYGAIMAALFCTWIFKKFIEPALDHGHGKISDFFRKKIRIQRKSR